MSASLPSVPAGLDVRMARRRIRPGMEAEADRWLAMINERRAEAVRTLERERVAVEIVFRERDESGDSLVWVVVQGRGGTGVADLDDSPFDIDREHLAFMERVVATHEPPQTAQVLLLPDPVRLAILAWAGLSEAD